VKIEKDVSGKAVTIREALRVLVREGYVSRREGTRSAKLYRSASPYRYLEEGLLDLVPTSSRPRPEEAGSPPLLTSSLVPRSIGDEVRDSDDLVPNDGDEVIEGEIVEEIIEGEIVEEVFVDEEDAPW
jgi:hypothetical protein